MWRKGNPCAPLVGMQTFATTVENSMELPQKIKQNYHMIQQSHHWIFTPPPKKKKRTVIQRYTCTPVFTAALFIIAKLWKQPQYPLIDEWIKQMW